MKSQIKQEEGIACPSAEGTEVKKEEGAQIMQEQPSYYQGAYALGSRSIALQNSWLLSLAKLNKVPIELQQISFRQILVWTTQVSQFLKHHIFSPYQPLFKLQFRNLEPKSLYYCLILPLDNSFSALKVRDEQGNLVYFRHFIIQSMLKEIKYLESIAGKNSNLLIYDESGIENYLTNIIQNNQSPNLVFIHPNRYSIDFRRENPNYTYRQINQTMVFAHKKILKKIPPLEDILDNFITFSTHDRNNLFQLLGDQLRHCLDRECLIQTIIRSMKEQYGTCTIEHITEFIDSGIQYLQQRVKSSEKYRNQHFPQNSSGKDLCRLCYKKKTEVQCKACGQVSGQKINLCLGKCFSEHHKVNQRLTFGSESTICNHVKFFDYRFEQILGLMNKIVDNEGQESLLQYIQRSIFRIIKTMNSIGVNKISKE